MRSAPLQKAQAERIAEVILEHAARISKEQDLSALIRLNADLARDLIGAERCSLWLKDPRAGELWTRVAHGVEEMRIPLGQGIVGACVAQEQAALVNDISRDPRFLHQVDDSHGYRTHSILCVPLRTETGVIGALQVLNKEGGFSEEDAELLRLVATYAASAIEAERLRHEAEAARLLQHELDLAAEVQRKLLPEHSEPVPKITYTGLCKPARLVGGDYYDFMKLPNGAFGLTLGDVSGKGIPAAVLMASIHTLLHSLLLRDPTNVSAVLNELNDAVHRRSTSNRYSTLFCGVLNAARTALTYVNAGDVPPMIVRSVDGRIERLQESDLPVGLMLGAAYPQHTADIYPGDLIVAVSDGIVEAPDEAGEAWDESRLESLLREQRHASPQEIAGTIVQRVEEYAGNAEQFDDMTVVIVRINAQ